MDIDLDDVKEKYWDKYLSYCHAENSVPSYSDFVLWWEEQAEGEYL